MNCSTTPAWTLRHEPIDDDRRRVREIVEATGFFTPAEVDVAVELVDDRIRRGEASEYQFVFADRDGQTAGYACYGLIACTVASFDLYWIAVTPAAQRTGLGRLLLAESERLIAAAGGRRVYIETSHKALYVPTRAFYLRNGYALEAVIKDFYAPGDDKAIYTKVLGE